MNKLFSTACIAVVLLTAATGADAQGWRGHNSAPAFRPQYQSEPWRFNNQYNNGNSVLVAGLLGLAVGAAIVQPRYRDPTLNGCVEQLDQYGHGHIVCPGPAVVTRYVPVPDYGSLCNGAYPDGDFNPRTGQRRCGGN